jgi:hypothetical protein
MDTKRSMAQQYHLRMEHGHTVDEHCWCQPYLYVVLPTGNEVWVHQTKRPPSAKLLAEAIAEAWSNGTANYTG